MLLVTHDRAFLDNVVTSTLAFEGDGVVREIRGRVGGLRAIESFERSSRSSRSSRSTEETEERERLERVERPNSERRKKRTFNEEREYAALPSRIEALEAEQQQLQREAGVAGVLQVAGGTHSRRCWRGSMRFTRSWSRRWRAGWSWRKWAGEDRRMNLWRRWMRQPQRVWLRRALFQIHLWTGIGLGLYVVMLSMTGSALVYRTELDLFFRTPRPDVRARRQARTQRGDPGDRRAAVSRLGR